MSRSMIVTGALGLLVLVSIVIVALNIPLKIYAGDALASINYTDLNNASALGGDVWLEIENAPGLTQVSYQWCPGLAPLSWCVDMKNTAFSIKGRVSLSGAESVRIQDVSLRSVDIAALGLASGLVDARFDGEIVAMLMPGLMSGQIGLSGCLIASLKEVDARFSTANLEIFGSSAGSHQLHVHSSGESSGQAIDADISGEAFTGRVQLSEGRYSATGEMAAPEAMVAMAQSFMRPLGGNRFGWEISGDLPC